MELVYKELVFDKELVLAWSWFYKELVLQGAGSSIELVLRSWFYKELVLA